MFKFIKGLFEDMNHGYSYDHKGVRLDDAVITRTKREIPSARIKEEPPIDSGDDIG